MTQGLRSHRVGERIRLEMAQALQKLGDPVLASLAVTEVSVTDDLGIAALKVRHITDEASEQQRRTVLRRLRRAAPRLRRHLASRVRLRRVPEIRFQYDTGPDARRRMSNGKMKARPTVPLSEPPVARHSRSVIWKI